MGEETILNFRRFNDISPASAGTVKGTQLSGLATLTLCV